MITLITGAPGTGKTAALVSLLSDLSRTRTVYCDGIPELTLDHQPLVDATLWHESVPDGSIVVIDEVQRVWRPRGPGAKVPACIAALETHRHRGLDFYIITQSPRLVDSNVRGLVGRHVHLRDLGILGRFWYEWPECSDQCSSSWKQAPLKKRYRLPKAVFSTYKSASEHIKPIRSVPWMLAVMVIALAVTVGMGYKVFTMISGKISPLPAVATQPKTVQDIIDKPAEIASVPDAYDPTSFIPRVSSNPESAPAYDALRKVVSMPVVSGCMVFADTCSCYTQQMTKIGMTDSECRTWLKNPAFDPYRNERRETATSRPAPAAAAPVQSQGLLSVPVV